MDIYDRINNLLKDNLMTRRQLSIKTGISYNTLTAMFQRRSTNIDIETLKKIADYFDVTIDYLLGNESELNNKQSNISMLISEFNKIGVDIENLNNEEFNRIMNVVKSVINLLENQKKE